MNQSFHKSSEYAIIFIAWGDQYIEKVNKCIEKSKTINQYDTYLITDKNYKAALPPTNVLRVNFKLDGFFRKTEILDYVPSGYECYLFLDSDTIVIDDIDLGFEKAKTHGIALSPAPHYSLDYFFGFNRIMQKENCPCQGQLQYNTGVIFFSLNKDVKNVFKRWNLLSRKYQDDYANDQPFLTLAMEQLDFNPYSLSISYNYRGFGDAISGVVRIWHSHDDIPENINTLENSWPPRKAVGNKIILPK